MYGTHPAFRPPADEHIKVWRYLSLPKFLSLIQRKALYFARYDTLGDPFEGSYAERDFPWREWEGIDRIRALHAVGVEQLADFERNREAYRRSREAYKMLTGINCWHMSDHESAAMWHIYSPAGDGIAIQSTFKRLSDAFVAFPRHDVFIGEVIYVDRERDHVPETWHYQSLLRKQRFFEYERELRAMCLPYGSFEPIPIPPPKGRYVDVDIRTLIERVYVTPDKPAWFVDMIESVAAKCDLAGVPIVPSRMNPRVEQSSANG